MVLARGASVTEEQWAEFVELYELGRDMVTREVHAVTTADEVPSELDTQTRRTLARLGGTLRETERIRLGPPDADRGRAVVTPRTRALLRKSAKQVETPEPRPVFAVGLVTEYNGTTLSFDLKTNDRVITCVLEVFNEQLAAAAREYLALDGVTAPDVRVEGQTLDDEDKIRRIYQVHTLEIVWTVAEKVIVSRLRALVGLGHNWLGPGTEAPTAELAEMLRHDLRTGERPDRGRAVGSRRRGDPGGPRSCLRRFTDLSKEQRVQAARKLREHAVARGSLHP